MVGNDVFYILFKAYKAPYNFEKYVFKQYMWHINYVFKFLLEYCTVTIDKTCFKS